MNRFCMMVLCLLLVMGWANTHAEKSIVNTFTVNKIKLQGVKKHLRQNISRYSLQDKLNIWREESYPQKN